MSGMLVFILLAIVVTVCVSLYRSMCPACNKLRAARHERSFREGGFFFGTNKERMRCRYCRHAWERNVHND